MKKHLVSGAVVALVASGLAACGGSGSGSSTVPTVVEVCAGVSGSPSLDGPAERIISLSAAATEMLWAVGAGDQVFAVDNYSDHPAEAAAKEPKLDGFEPSVEAIAGYEPDLVVISYDPGALVEQLCGLGIAVWTGEPAASLAEIYEQISALGVLTGREDEATTLVDSIEADIDDAVSRVADSVDLDGATYYFELGTGYYALTSATFQGEILGRLGMTSIADEGADAGAGSQQLNAEAIIAADPDVIFLADVEIEGQTPEVVAARPGWSAMSAVADPSRIIALDDDVANRWGPRVAELADAMASALVAIGK